MSGIAIYVEGGGDSAQQKAHLRHGFDAFLGELKDQARKKRMTWKVVPSRGRQQTVDAFLNEVMGSSDQINILLVDAEVEVLASPRTHLRDRDGWDLSGVNENRIHLMVRVMETWIVADPDAVAGYYGQGFLENALPRATDLETVAKTDIYAALSRASRPTQKGEYKKIRHGGDLLMRIDRNKVAARCRHCERLLSRLAKAIREA